ncbi:HAD-like domain-containing protein [Trichoderma compactum]
MFFAGNIYIGRMPLICVHNSQESLTLTNILSKFIIRHKSSIIMASSSPNWRPKVIIFDLLTALLDSWTLWDASTPSATAAEGRLWRARYLELTFGTGAYVPYEQLVYKAAKEVGLPESAPRTLLENWDKLQPWPEDAQVLKQLRLRGYNLGVVTNCSKRLGNIAANIVGKFDSVVTAEESGFYKPVKQAYQAILTTMGVQPQDAFLLQAAREMLRALQTLA